jgi:ribosomal protein S18 acetylase RimI-like enzyme
MPSMTELPVIRSPGPEDVRAAAELHYRSWITTYDPVLTPDEAERLRLTERVEHWERLVRGQPSDRGALVAERNGCVVGLVEWEIGPEGDGAVGEVHAIHVAVEERGRGLGKDLLVASLEAMRSLGVRRAVLWVLEANSAARHFYERHGWVWDGTRVERPLGGFAHLPPVIEVRYTIDLVRAPSAREG